MAAGEHHVEQHADGPHVDRAVVRCRLVRLLGRPVRPRAHAPARDHLRRTRQLRLVVRRTARGKSTNAGERHAGLTASPARAKPAGAIRLASAVNSTLMRRKPAIRFVSSTYIHGGNARWHRQQITHPTRKFGRGRTR
eukprot:3627341-Pleurochrysis_carterae.AAC.1